MTNRSATATFLELRLGARLAAVRVLNDLFDVALSALGVSEGLRHDLTLGVAELVANVCEHEYAGAEGEVLVRLDVREDEVRVTVVSQGDTFDLQAALDRAAAHDPLEALEGDLDGGRGFVLLTGLFDEVRLEREAGRNRITLRRSRA